MNAPHLWHLATRFFGSVRPGPPGDDDERWAASQLGGGEQKIWQQMSNPDRRHAVGVARAVVGELGPGVDRPVVAAALLHDSGKVVSGLRTPARVVATILWGVIDDEVAQAWADGRSTLKRRFGQYRRHPELGADLLAAAGAHPLTVAWAREHHQPPATWTVDSRVARVLKACDDD